MKKAQPRDPASMSRYAALKAAGIPDKEIDRPMVAVLAAAHPLLPGSGAIKEWAAAAALGVQSCGGNPVLINLPGAAAAASFGEDCEWPRVAALAALVERMVKDLAPDALVLVADSEASLISMLRGAARTDLPAVCVPGDGGWFEGGWDLLMARGWDYVSGKISREDWMLEFEDSLSAAGFGGGVSHPGSFKYLAEALGLCLPGSANFPAGAGAKIELARQSGWEAVTLANTGVRLSHLISSGSLRNALAVDASLGGSAAGVWALAQVAGEMGLSLNRQWLSPANAKGYLKTSLDGVPDLDLWRREGGIPGLLLLLWEAGALDESAKGVLRTTLKETLADYSLPPEPAVFIRHPGVVPSRRTVFVTGPLLPRGAIFEIPSGVEQAQRTAKVFQREEEAVDYVTRHPKNQGEMLVLHNQGGRVRDLASALRATGADFWVLSDGEISGRVPTAWGFRLPGRAGTMRAIKDNSRVALDFKTGRLEAEAGDKPAATGLNPLETVERERLAGFGFLEV